MGYSVGVNGLGVIMNDFAVHCFGADSFGAKSFEVDCDIYSVPKHFGLPDLLIKVQQAKLVGLDWLIFDTPANSTALDKLSINNQTNQKLILIIKQQLEEYFTHRRRSFDVPVNVGFGTPFQQRVWQALTQIAYAQTISYAQLAKRINQPSAYRACANANGKNPISLIIPCHRVIASDGGIGGYTGGVFIKKTLLEHEKNFDIKGA